MAQQTFKQRTTIKRMDECARDAERAQHEETLSNARRASKRAQRAAQDAATLVAEIEWVLS